MFGYLNRRFRAWQQERVAIRRLHLLDDHILRDMGTEREGIEAFVRGRRRA